MKNRLSKWLLCAGLAIIMFASVTLAVAASDDTENVASYANAQENDVRFGYSLLTDNEKHVYDRLLEGVTAETPYEEIELDYARAIEPAEIEKAYALFLGDHPECFWLDNGYRYSSQGTSIVSVSPAYNFHGDELVEAKAAFDEATADILADMPAGNNYTKALYLHDALANRVVYEQVGFHQTAYGALVDGRAVCAGYAAAYQYLLRHVGIEASTVTGSSIDPNTDESIPHAWNIVWIDSESCVYTDVTWDDQGDTIYHYYFNLSRDEIEADHTTNTDIYTLPECDHTEESYFDVNDCEITFSITPEEMALRFGSANADGERRAAIYYTGEQSFDAWIKDNIEDLYCALNGSAGSYSYGYTSFGNEIHITVKGNFTTIYHNVSIITDDKFVVMGDSEQRIADGDSINLVISAAPGYYFPSDYPAGSSEGITVCRDSYSQITVTGKPRADLTVTPIAPTAKTQEKNPNAVFTATGYNSGVLSGVHSGILFSTDGQNWYRCNSNEIELSDLEPCEMQVIVEGTDTTADSLPQTIVITRKELPELNVLQPSIANATGSISADVNLEYSKDYENWISGGTAITELLPEIYYVRAAGSGNALASEEHTVEIVCNHALPDIWETDESSHTRSCHCGEKVQSESHKFGEWKQVASGEYVRTCENCGIEEKKIENPSNSSGENNNSANNSGNSGTVINSGTHKGMLNSGCSMTLSGSAATLILSFLSIAFVSKKRR